MKYVVVTRAVTLLLLYCQIFNVSQINALLGLTLPFEAVSWVQREKRDLRPSGLSFEVNGAELKLPHISQSHVAACRRV